MLDTTSSFLGGHVMHTPEKPRRARHILIAAVVVAVLGVSAPRVPDSATGSGSGETPMAAKEWKRTVTGR